MLPLRSRSIIVRPSTQPSLITCQVQRAATCTRLDLCCGIQTEFLQGESNAQSPVLNLPASILIQVSRGEKARCFLQQEEHEGFKFHRRLTLRTPSWSLN
eukprot:TRINITY_DN7028_c0_g1_i2.p1 TRINITY_DN7028_c0_g1~~TRINITY_DN7028_c0_g1_i2.p1  ORF type:complete len:100 (-),score=2.03 TRINITY_DN7028_c0_g1_i2:122-421(-)